MKLTKFPMLPCLGLPGQVLGRQETVRQVTNKCGAPVFLKKVHSATDWGYGIAFAQQAIDLFDACHPLVAIQVCVLSHNGGAFDRERERKSVFCKRLTIGEWPWPRMYREHQDGRRLPLCFPPAS
ncbi:hypothetical protein [Bradyrhizobium sp. USDA 4506]